MSAFIGLSGETEWVAVDQIAAIVTEQVVTNPTRLATEPVETKPTAAIWLKGGRTIRPTETVAEILELLKRGQL